MTEVERSAEFDRPELRPEEWLLTELGFGEHLNTAIPGFTDSLGNPVVGGNFLEAYKTPDHRQATELKITVFKTLSPTEDAEDYAIMHGMFTEYMVRFFGPKTQK